MNPIDSGLADYVHLAATGGDKIEMKVNADGKSQDSTLDKLKFCNITVIPTYNNQSSYCKSIKFQLLFLLIFSNNLII